MKVSGEEELDKDLVCSTMQMVQNMKDTGKTT